MTKKPKWVLTKKPDTPDKQWAFTDHVGTVRHATGQQLTDAVRLLVNHKSKEIRDAAKAAVVATSAKAHWDFNL